MHLTLLAALAAALLIPSGWSSYGNARFGYSFSYPTPLLRPLAEADNSDGRKFAAFKGSAVAAVFGSYSVDEYGLKSSADAAESKCAGGKPHYRIVKSSLMAVSCQTLAGDITYTTAIQRGDVIVEFDVRYPLAERATWNAVVTTMSKHLAFQ